MSGTRTGSTRPSWAVLRGNSGRAPWHLTLPLVLALALASACAPPPPIEHIQLYAETAAQTRAAGYVVLDRIAPIIVAQGEGGASPAKDCGPDKLSGIPRCLDLQQISERGVGRSDPPAIAIQKTALDLVAAYARILAGLAEGKSAADVQAEIGIAATVAGALVTLTGVGAPIGAALPLLAPQIQALAGRLEAARAGQLVRQSLIADKDTIQAVLKALEDSTPAMYEIYKARRQLDRVAALETRDRTTANAAVEDIKRYYAAIEAYVRLLRATSAALDTLARDAQQPAKANPQAALKQAIDARAEAQALWNTVRQLEGTHP